MSLRLASSSNIPRFCQLCGRLQGTSLAGVSMSSAIAVAGNNDCSLYPDSPPPCSSITTSVQYRRQPGSSSPARGARLTAESARGGNRLTLEDACGEIHQALSPLPVLTSPGQVPFTDGLYLFYEDGETSTHGPAGRVVRVGNHPRSDGGLLRRLQQHYSGGKNGSVFRKFLGGAILRLNGPSHPCLQPGPGRGHWERQDASKCQLCKPIEKEVSDYISTHMRFRCVSVPDRTERNRLEQALVATLATCTVCRPSTGWLGLNAYSESVRASGLWNSQFTNGQPMTGEGMQRLKELVKLSLQWSGGHSQMEDTL